MTLHEFKSALLETAIQNGCTAAEVSFSESDDFSVSVLEGKIDKYKVAQDAGISLRVVYEGHDGFASTKAFEDPTELVLAAIDNAKTADTEDEHPMQGRSEYRKVTPEYAEMSDFSERRCIDLALDIEKKALSYDKRVKRVMNCTVSKSESKSALQNTSGLDAAQSFNYPAVVLGIVMEQDGETQFAYDYRFGKDTADIDGLIESCIKDGSEKFGASPVPVGEYRVLFTNKCFCEMLDLYSSIFSADAAQKGLSALAGKENSIIASECISICEDPYMQSFPILFDGEGVPTQQKRIVDRGTLKTLLHSLKTAKKAGCASTGNGTRSGSCETANIYIQGGDKSFDELVQGERVLVIAEVDGAGAGVNTVSGEFSLSAKGQLYENGKRVRAVNQITVAGNFYDLLKNVVAVGNDLIFQFPYMGGMGLIGSPCVLVDKLNIAG